MRVLVVNAGSSTLKLRLLGPDDEVSARCDLDPWRGEEDATEVASFLEGAARVDAVGHRVVHGGADLRQPTVLDEDVVSALEALVPLAPLHQPGALAGIRAVGTAMPDVPAVACFDTAFHSTLPAPAATYALPRRWRDRWPLRRYGFHGLSHAHAVRRATELVGPSPTRRVVSCHLGAGASLCAALDGRSVDTTMGFTPLEGLVMATRAGSVDPGLVLWLLQRGGLGLDEVAGAMEHESGLAGLYGGSGDMREVVAAAGRGDEAAGLALDVYVHRLRREIAAMAAALGGLDVLVFTGGVGEHQPRVRVLAADGLEFLGVRLDPARNTGASGDADVSAEGAPARTVVVTAREDLEIARQVRARLG